MSDAPTSWKCISVFLGDTAQSGRVGDCAAALARRFQAHLVGIHGIDGIPGSYAADSFVRGAAISDVIARHQAAERVQTFAVARRLAQLADKYDIPTEFRVIRWGHGEEEALLNLLHCDLAVLGHPTPYGVPPNWTTERLGMSSGVPFLLIPDGWDGQRIGARIVVAWNGSREARRAIADAMPLLSTAQSVTVLVVEPARTPEKYGEDPGVDITTHLARHCGDVDLRQVEAGGASIAEVVIAQAEERGADLIVFGAYSHARSAEKMFGGTTRDLLARLPLPALVSR